MKTRFLQAKSIGGFLALALLGSVGSVQAHPATHYVSEASTNPTPPYTNWATAAANIQDAVNVAVPGDSIMVTNGVYPGGVTVGAALTLVSVNGPQVTVINGGGTNPCVSLFDGASLTGFTLTNGSGVGVSCDASGVVSNCASIANLGAGAAGGTLYNCTLTDNSGDGADWCILYNCALTCNAGWGVGGGTNYNCTLTGNAGGGASGAALFNCLVYFNTALGGANYDSACALSYCCTTPLPPNGVGNLALDPQLASASHLSAESPCIGAGSAAYATGTDIDGDAWNNPPSIGCDEYHAGTVMGPLTVSPTATYTNVATGFPVGLTALIAGQTDLSVWDFGDGSVQVNEPYTSHTWTAPGDYLVALWAFNDSCPNGVSTTVTLHVVEGVYYVAASSGTPIAPFTSWATAATNIQDAVNVAPPGATIFVTNGTYAPVDVGKSLVLHSVNGPGVTIISGGSRPCAYFFAYNAVMVGFTLTNGFVVGGYGGGADCESSSDVLSNCVLTGNTAIGVYFSDEGDVVTGGQGGGAWGGTLNNCTLTGNIARVWPGGPGLGGGAYASILNNCTLTGNSAGGAYASTLNNCIVYFNSDSYGGNYDNYDSSSTLNYCCTTPLPGGIGNITNAPLFVDYTNGNLRLQSNSPCINSGNNAYVVGSTDLDGNPRIVGGTVDIGAYEYQTPLSMISYAWLQQYGLPINTNTDTADLDGTGFNVYQDWIAGLNPTNALSVLKMLAPVATNNPAGLAVTWQSVSGITYFLQSSTNLAAQPAFTTIQSNIVGQAGTTSYTDTNAVGPGPFFYRVGVGQ